MEFFEVVQNRRSIRKFTAEAVPEHVIDMALDAALLAPNSSNTQTWDFYWVRTPEKKAALVHACFSQAAARAAQELIVIVADPALWRRSQKPLVEFVESVNAPRPVIEYYKKLIPATYTWGPLNTWGVLKSLGAQVAGLFRSIPRGPHTKRDLQEVAIKSAGLAAENFVLSITAQGFATCMMEGFDEARVKKILGVSGSARVVMCIAAGREAERGTWGPRFRLPREQVIHKI
jgi:nitroreductase